MDKEINKAMITRCVERELDILTNDRMIKQRKVSEILADIARINADIDKQLARIEELTQ